jgi:hypothetical protein
MLTLEHIQIVRSCAIVLMTDNFQLDADGILNKICGIISDPKNHTQIIDQYPCLQVLIDANIPPAEIETGAQFSNDHLKRNVEIAIQLNRLKFSRVEVFNMVKTWSVQDLNNVLNYSEQMRTFSSRVSGIMTRFHLTVNEAIEQVLQPGTNYHLPHITKVQVNKLLSKQAILELYLHAKAGMVMNVDYYDPNKQPEHRALHQNAKFHSEHQDKLFWDTDKSLTDLGFTVAQTNELLFKHDNVTTIAPFFEKILVMQKAANTMKAMLHANSTLQAAEAQALVLANMTGLPGLSNQEFQELLSEQLNNTLHSAKLELPETSEALPQAIFAENRQPSEPLNMNPNHLPLSINDIQARFSQLNNRVVPVPNLIPGISNQTLSHTLSVTTIFLLLVVIYRTPTIVTGSYNFIRNSCDRVMGIFCRQPKEPTSPLLEVQNRRSIGTVYHYETDEESGPATAQRRHF